MVVCGICSMWSVFLCVVVVCGVCMVWIVCMCGVFWCVVCDVCVVCVYAWCVMCVYGACISVFTREVLNPRAWHPYINEHVCL